MSGERIATRNERHGRGSASALLDVQRAAVTAATVTIQALTIGKRQVTQSVYKQLEERPLLTETGKRRGEPWGTVNYHPDKVFCAAGAHLHVVWQQAGAFRRAKVMRDFWLGEAAPRHDQLIKELAALAWLAVTALALQHCGEVMPLGGGGGSIVKVGDWGFTFTPAWGQRFAALWQHHAAGVTDDAATAALQAALTPEVE